MQWNWQQRDWPHFTYKKPQFERLEKQFLQGSGVLMGAFKHLSEGDKSQLKIDLISNEALKTSEIEGEYLNRDSLQSSIRRHFGLAADKRKVSLAEQGIAELMVDLYESFSKKLTHTTLFTWHEMLCKGRTDLQDIGKYRTHDEPMQVISGPLHKPKIHFEAPPSSRVKKEMDGFIAWFNDSKNTLPPLTRASIAHLYFECIHPFEDGNGRIGRAIAEKALAQSLGHPTLIALADTIEKHKKHYYDALEKANKCNEITPWNLWFAAIILEAQEATQNRVEFLISKTKFFDTFRGQLNARQEKVVLRLFKEGPDGFEGGLSAEKYSTIAKTSSATATRDLQDLVAKGVLRKTGELRYTRYWLEV